MEASWAPCDPSIRCDSGCSTSLRGTKHERHHKKKVQTRAKRARESAGGSIGEPSSRSVCTKRFPATPHFFSASLWAARPSALSREETLNCPAKDTLAVCVALWLPFCFSASREPPQEGRGRREGRENTLVTECVVLLYRLASTRVEVIVNHVCVPHPRR